MKKYFPLLILFTLSQGADLIPTLSYNLIMDVHDKDSNYFADEYLGLGLRVDEHFKAISISGQIETGKFEDGTNYNGNVKLGLGLFPEGQGRILNGGFAIGIEKSKYSINKKDIIKTNLILEVFIKINKTIFLEMEWYDSYFFGVKGRFGYIAYHF